MSDTTNTIDRAAWLAGLTVGAEVAIVSPSHVSIEKITSIMGDEFSIRPPGGIGRRFLRKSGRMRGRVRDATAPRLEPVTQAMRDSIELDVMARNLTCVRYWEWMEVPLEVLRGVWGSVQARGREEEKR